MKKSLFILATAALVLASCNNDVKIAENKTLGNEPQEIALSPLAKKATIMKAASDNYQYAIDGTTFPQDLNMYVAAYQVEPTKTNYFAGTQFVYNNAGGTGASSTHWGGATARYWPLSPCYINFLAYANLTSGSATWGSPDYASQVVLAMADNSTAQNDLMYAIGGDGVTQTGSTLTFPTAVDMEFKHAQAWVDFYVKANTDGVETAIKVNSITLNGASYSGTYTVTHSNYDEKTGQSVSGAWTLLGAKGKNSSSVDTNVASEVASDATEVAVPGIAGGGQTLTASLAQAGKGLMIVPDDNSSTADFISFTINFTYDSKTYEYTYAPATAAAANVDQAKHHIFNITFKLHEIFVDARVDDWDDASSNITVQN